MSAHSRIHSVGKEPGVWRKKGQLMAQVIQRVEGRYEVQEVELGRVYRWRPGRVVVQCGCGGRATLTSSETTCGCGADYAAVLDGQLAARPLEDEAVHPWRYVEDREDAGIPY